MDRTRSPFSAAGRTLALVLALLAGGGHLARAATEVVAWRFDRPGDLQGWQPNGDLTEVTVTNGALRCRARGSDPILELRPLVDFPSTPWQTVEIRLKADHDGTAELFWSNTPQGRYGGFTQEKSTRFNVAGDGRWHTYSLLPCWHLEGKIVRLRFDVFDAARFELASIRILDLQTPPPTDRADFDFSRPSQGWRWIDGAEPREFSGTWTARRPVESVGALVLSPPLAIDAASNSIASVRMAVDHGQNATLYFITDRQNHLSSLTFPIEADGQEHTYNVLPSGARDWRGRVLAVGLRPSDAPAVSATVRWLKLAAKPQGPPQLKLLWFGLEDVLPRAGRPMELRAAISNTGGEPASNGRARLTLPAGMRLTTGSAAEQDLPTLEFGKECSLAWTAVADRPIEGTVSLKVAADRAPAISATASARVTAPPTLKPAGYVPEPHPVRGPIEVGAYYFPGWKTAKQWQPLRNFPERKPVLGWYREGDPEVADWHIKWAVEHGITFFAYDWYWNQGQRQLEHALHDGYFKARYRHLLKFCLLWANHNPPKTSSHADCLAVTRYWLDHYFRLPEHLAFDGKPVVIIFSPGRLTEDLGSAGVKRAFEAMREACRAADLKGLYLIACVGDAGAARRAAAEGYDAVTAYNWPGLGMSDEGMFAPFETLVPAYRRNWEHLVQDGLLPLTPLPVCGGWDSRPWHGANNLVRFGRTPELFLRHLLDARKFVEHQPAMPGADRAVLIEAWNEWGEGSYIEPHAEFGFGYLDAIRQAFAETSGPHEDLTPADAGLGPYDVQE